MKPCFETIAILESVCVISDEIHRNVAGELSSQNGKFKKIDTEFGEVCGITLMAYLDLFVRFRVCLDVVAEFLTGRFGVARCHMLIKSMTTPKKQRSGESMLRKDGTEKNSRERKQGTSRNLYSEAETMNANAVAILFDGMDRMRIAYPIDLNESPLREAKVKTTGGKPVRLPENMGKLKWIKTVEKTDSVKVSRNWHTFTAVTIDGKSDTFAGIFDHSELEMLRRIIRHNEENWSNPYLIQPVAFTCKSIPKINEMIFKNYSRMNDTPRVSTIRRVKRSLQGLTGNIVFAAYAASVYNHLRFEFGSNTEKQIVEGLNEHSEDKFARRNRDSDGLTIQEEIESLELTELERDIVSLFNRQDVRRASDALELLNSNNGTNSRTRSTGEKPFIPTSEPVSDRTFYYEWKKVMRKINRIATDYLRNE